MQMAAHKTKIPTKIISLILIQVFLAAGLVYPWPHICHTKYLTYSLNIAYIPNSLRKPLDSVSGYQRQLETMEQGSFATELSEIIKRLESGDEKALGVLFDLSKRVMPGTIFTIAKIDKVFNEKKLEQGVIEGHIIPLTDFVKIDGAKITKGVPGLLNALIKLGIIDISFGEENGVCLVPMREADPSRSGDSLLHDRSLSPEKFDIEKGVLIWKGNGGSQLNQGLPFNADKRSEHNTIYGGITTGEIDSNISAAQKLENALSEARKIDPSIPEDLFITPAVSFVPLYVYLQKDKEDLIGEGLKIIKEGKNSLAGAFIPTEKIIPFLRKFGGLTEEKKKSWKDAIKDIRFFAYTAPAPWRTRGLWSHLDFFQAKLGTYNRKEIFYGLIRRYALIAAIIRKKMDMIASNRLILQGHRLASIFSETNMGYAAFDYNTLASREEFLEEYIKQIPEGQREGRKQELERAAGVEFEEIRKEELNILKEDTIRYTAQGILETYDENDIIEALRYFDDIYEAFGYKEGIGAMPAVDMRSAI